MRAMKAVGRVVAIAAMFSAIVIPAASAAELAEWLAGGSEITSPLKAKYESLSSILLEDTLTEAEIEVTVSETGTVGPTEKGVVETITVLSSKIVKAGSCGTLESVQAVNLPWKTELYLAGATYREHISTEALEKLPGWLVECLFLGIKVADTCTGNISAVVANTPEDVDTEFDLESEAEVATCTLGGAKTGITLAGGPLLASAEPAELKLAVSSGVAPPPAPRIEQVDFSGNQSVLVDHTLNVVPEKAISIKEVTGGGNDEIEWKEPKAGELIKNWPVVYALGDKIKLEARFALEAAAQVFLETKLEGEVTLGGSMTTGGKTLTFSRKLTQGEVTAQMVAHKTYLSTGALPVESNEELPLEVRLYENVLIKWKWAAKETGRLNAYEQQIGSSNHNIYVTFLKALTTENYLTLLDMDTAGIAEEPQAPTEAQAIAGAWRAFKHEEEGVPSMQFRVYDPKTGVIERNGLTLKYYAEVTPGSTLAALAVNEPARCTFFEGYELLEKAEGQCGAWAETLGFALVSEGIKSKGVGLLPSLYTMGPCVLAGCIILVKNWEFAAGGGAKPGEEFPYEANEVTELLGIVGQGVQNPSSWFAGHVIVEAGSALYDPSYGLGPISGAEALKKYQEASIAGVCSGTRPAFKCQVTPGALILEEKETFKF
jgi:hypothetical protein